MCVRTVCFVWVCLKLILFSQVRECVARDGHAFHASGLTLMGAVTEPESPSKGSLEGLSRNSPIFPKIIQKSPLWLKSLVNQ